MHYVCIGGCQGVAEEKGVCQAPNCKDYHKDLKECDCEDGKHEEVMKQDDGVKE